jgi:hypothetical protein
MTITTWVRLLPITIRRAATMTLAAASAMATFHSPAFAQSGHQYHGGGHHAGTGSRPNLHINPRWKECSFQLDASLTQAAWRQFAGEAGVVTYFRPLIDAAPMGAGKFEVSVLQWETGIDDSDAAWNDTFVHRDSTHWLFEGDRLAFPGLTVRAGLTSRTDVGAYLTKSPGANYGFYGAQIQQNLLQDSAKGWSAAARASFVSMYGPEDLDFSVYGVDLVASRKYAWFSGRVAVAPYVGVSGSLSRAQEKSSVVALRDENVLGALGTIGAVAEISKARIAVEYSAAQVRSLSFKVGVGVR